MRCPTCVLASHIAHRLYTLGPLILDPTFAPPGSVLLGSFNKGLQGLNWRSRHLALGKDSVAPSGLNITPMPSGTWIPGVPALDTLGLPLLPMGAVSAHGGSVSVWKGRRLGDTAVMLHVHLGFLCL